MLELLLLIILGVNIWTLIRVHKERSATVIVEPISAALVAFAESLDHTSNSRWETYEGHVGMMDSRFDQVEHAISEVHGTVEWLYNNHPEIAGERHLQEVERKLLQEYEEHKE